MVWSPFTGTITANVFVTLEIFPISKSDANNAAIDLLELTSTMKWDASVVISDVTVLKLDTGDVNFNVTRVLPINVYGGIVIIVLFVS